ncbi:MAG: isopentenyl-diphosphate Delta-isomerase [Agathobacter sp.]|nr:isopentenyl-diphosphate Delta-isomerase [Agathobacter sp.]
MEKNASDKLIWVDLFDNEIGSGDKLETHVKNQLHRAFSLFVVYDGKMLIQRRALSKYHSGGLWANACCSHPRYGEELPDAVQKRMEEELGIAQGSCQPEELFSFNYFSQYDGLSEYEIDHVFLTDYHGEINPDPDEIMELRWISLEDLQKEMQDAPQTFSTWFLIAAPRVMEYVNKKEK